MVKPGTAALVSSLLVLGFTACGGAEGDEELCAEAEAHVKACFPDDEVVSPAECDPAAAERTVTQTCAELEGQAKTDGFCNPWMWWTCQSDGSSDGSDDAAGNSDDWRDERELWVRVKACTDDLCDRIMGAPQCARVVVRERGGDDVASQHTGIHGSAGWTEIGLTGGEYVAEVRRRDGSVAEMMVEEGSGFGKPGRAPAEVAFEVGDDDSVGIDVYVTQEEAEKLGRCAKLQSTVAAACDGAAMPAEETEWAFFARLRGESADGEYVDYTRPFQLHERPNTASFQRVLAGEYTLSFLEMDIPEFRRENNPDYERLVDLYATGREHTHDVTIQGDDAGSELDVGHFELDHEACD